MSGSRLSAPFGLSKSNESEPIAANQRLKLSSRRVSASLVPRPPLLKLDHTAASSLASSELSTSFASSNSGSFGGEILEMFAGLILGDYHLELKLSQSEDQSKDQRSHYCGI